VLVLEHALDAPTTTCFTLDVPARRRIERMVPGKEKNLPTFIREGIDPLLEREDCLPRPVRTRRPKRSFR
jgi:hypothetical protein